MSHSINTIIGEDALKEHFDLVKEKLKTYGEVIVIGNDGEKVYKITYLKMSEIKRPKAKCATLVEAIEVALKYAPEDAVHVDQIVMDIDYGKLYYKKDGSLVKREDVRATAQNYPQKFECLKGNYIRLKKESGSIKVLNEEK